MKKYYIYLNGQQYMEIPKSYNIKKNIYMNYGDLIDRILKDRGTAGTATWDKKIELLSKLVKDTKFTDDTIRHELKHVEQMSDPKFQEKYIQATNLLGYMNNPYEIEARDWGARVWEQLHRTGKFDIEHQKTLEKWQKEYPGVFKDRAGYEKRATEMYKSGEDTAGFISGMAEWKKRSEQNLKTAIKQVQKHGGEPKMLTREQEWQKDINKRKAIELIRTRLNKFMK